MSNNATAIPMWTLGDRLSKARSDAGISPAAMAARLRVHRNTISNWEHDRVDVPYLALRAWSDETGVALWWLVGDNGGDDSPTHGYRPPDCVTLIGLAA